MKNKNQKRIIALTIAFLLFSGYRIINKSQDDNIRFPDSDTSLSVDKIESNLKIKYLQTGTDNEGKEYVSFNYEVLPAEANDKTVTLNLTWSNTEVLESVNSYLTYEHNQDNYFVKVTMLTKANNQAKLTLTSNANPNANASILIDFEQEFLGFEPRSFSIQRKTLTGTSGEKFISDEELQNGIMQGSKGFLGTVSIAEKEISNYSKTFKSVSAYTNWPFKVYLDGNADFNTAYNEIRSTSTTTAEYIAKLSNYFKDNLSDEDKAKIRGADVMILDATYEVTFDYYGASYTFDRTEKYEIAVSIFEDATYVDVSSITTEGNIIFK